MLTINKIDTSKHAIYQRQLMELGIIPNHPGVTIFCATQGGGKSTLVANLLSKENMYGKSHEGVKIIPNKKTPKQPYFSAIFAFLGSHDDMFDHLIDTGVIKQNHVCHDPTPEAIQKVIDEQKAVLLKADGDMKKVPRILFLFDDIMNDAGLMRSKSFLDLFVNGRHINSSTWLLSQYLNLIPKACRTQANWLFIGKCNRSEMTIMCDQYCPPDMTKREFSRMICGATADDEKSRNNFFVVVKRASEDQKFRKNLDQFINLKRMRKKPKIKMPTKKEQADLNYDIEQTIRELDPPSIRETIAHLQNDEDLIKVPKKIALPRKENYCRRPDNLRR